MNTETRNWFMLWSLLGRPRRLPFHLFRTIPLEALQETVVFECVHEGIRIRCKYELPHPVTIQIGLENQPSSVHAFGSLKEVLSLVKLVPHLTWPRG